MYTLHCVFHKEQKMVTAVQSVIHVSERVMKAENSVPKQTLMIPLMMNIILQRKEKKEE
jgi:hypothetical protein